MKKNFCKVRRGHCLSLVWIVSFLLWGNVTMARIAYSGGKTFYTTAFSGFESGFL